MKLSAVAWASQSKSHAWGGLARLLFHAGSGMRRASSFVPTGEITSGYVDG